MVGTLTSVASLTIGLAMTSAFVLPVTKVTPPADSAWKKQASTSLGAPLAVDGTRLGVSGTLSRISDNNAAEVEKKRLPRVPSAEGYASSSSGSVYPLHAFMGLEGADTIQDGNATAPIEGGVDSVEGGEDTKPEIIEDGNATVPIVGGVGSEEGGDSGVASMPQDEAVVQYRITVTMEEMTTRETFFDERESITVIAAAAHESATTTQAEDGDSAHGVSEDADFATDANLATDTDANLDTNEALEHLDQQQMYHEASSDVIHGEGRQIISIDSDFGEEGPFDFDDDGLIDELSLQPFCPELVEYAAADEMPPVLNDTDDSAFFTEEHPFNLAADGLVDEMNNLVPSDLATAEDVVADEMAVMPHDIHHATFNEELVFNLVDDTVADDTSVVPPDLGMADYPVGDETTSVPHDALSDGTAPEEVFFDDPANDLVWSVMCDTLAKGKASKSLLLLRDSTNDNMRSRLFKAITGRAHSESVGLADLLDNMVTSLLHDAFFGSAASKAVFSLAERTDDNEVAADYVRAVDKLYQKFKKVRHRTTATSYSTFNEELVFNLVADDDVIDETSIGSFGPDMPDDAVDYFLGSVPHGVEYNTFNEELVFNLIPDDDVIDEMFIWPFDFVMAEGTAADEATTGLYDDISDDGAASQLDIFDYLANELVMSVVRDALARGTASEEPMLDEAMDNRMRSKLLDAISGRAPSGSVNLADALDGMIVSLLHDAFFGPAASKAVSSLAKSAHDSELVVDDYVRAVAKLYDKFKKAKGRGPESEAPDARKADHQAEGKNPDSEAPAVPKDGRGGGDSWLRKLWRRFRRKGR